MKNIYEIGSIVREFKEECIVNDYISNIKQNSDIVDKKQEQFAKQITNLLLTSNNKDEITIIPARCGMGKSTLIKEFLDNLSTNYCLFGKPNLDEIEPYGVIIITDRIDRLEEIMNYKNLNNKCYFIKYDNKDLESNNRGRFNQQIQEQYKYPILLITTQRYFKMKKNERAVLYKWAKGNREIAIIDEKPYIISSTIINEKYLSEISNSIDEVFESEQKQYLINTFRKIRNDIDYMRDTYSANYEIMWLKKSKNSMLVDEKEDKKFFDILASNVSSDIYNKFQMLKEIFTDGCLFVNKKNKDQTGERNLILVNNNLDKFDTDRCKYYVFDATSYFDIDYTLLKNYKYIDVDDKKANKDILLHHINISTSQKSLKTNAKLIETISKWINKNFNLDDTFICTYGKKSGIYDKFSKYLKFDDIGYFGNIKGSNEHQDKKYCFHIGLNRQADYVYLQTYIVLKNKADEWNNNDDDTVHSEIGKLLLQEHGRFSNVDMDSIMVSKLVIDTEQNIMRIRCRHFSNIEKCNIYILCSNNYSDVIRKLQNRVNAEYLTYIPLELNEFISADRVNCIVGYNEFINWYNLWDGTLIKVSEIRKIIGINDKQWENLKKHKVIQSKLDTLKQPKKGYYCA